MISFFLSYWINNEFRVPIFEGLNIKNVIAVLLIVLIVYWLFFIVFKIHKSLWKYIGPVETMRIGFAVICSTIVLGAGFLLLQTDRFLLSVIVTGGLLSAMLMFALRVSYRLYRRTVMNPVINTDKAIIIGAGDAGYILSKELLQNNSFNVHIVGFIDGKEQAM